MTECAPHVVALSEWQAGMAEIHAECCSNGPGLRSVAGCQVSEVVFDVLAADLNSNLGAMDDLEVVVAAKTAKEQR